MTDAMYDVRQEQYPTVIREMIRHENDVTNHRIMWLLIGQGFIANAYVSVKSDGASANLLLGLAGMLIALSAFVMLAEVFKRLRPQNCEPERLVFATSKGTPLNPKNLYNRQLAPACDAIELPRVSWHSFRHTHATLLHDAGESLKTAQSLLGHSDLETTLGVYTHAIPDSQRRAVERVAGVLDPVGLNSLPEGNPGDG